MSELDIHSRILDAAMSDGERSGELILARLALVISYVIELQPEDKRRALLRGSLVGIADRCGITL